jgi:hypothetical protein
MRWLSAAATWTLPAWWGTTLCMLVVFLPPGVLFGYGVDRCAAVAPATSPDVPAPVAPNLERDPAPERA